MLYAERESRELTMAVTLELSPEREAAPPTSIAHLQKTDPRNRPGSHAWAESHDRTTPLLSDEAIGRDSIYPDRA
jgi:hypothetical protein